MFPEFDVSDQTKKAFASERMAAVVGEDLMDYDIATRTLGYREMRARF